ncbi:unnamed protein product [Arctia plantaginis]|uniref:Uncharacterized protein n=1 Tax=Arctia plantaginis TaxID=874455 RepID=A0A8S0ZRM5_ARCPL|nr:unnamed protein product [Arctia plantaginis]
MLSAHNSRLDQLEGYMMEIKKQNTDIKTRELERFFTFVSDKLTSLVSKITSLEKENMVAVPGSGSDGRV